MSSQVATQLEPWSQLNDKVVMVTGASSGLGKEFCIDLAKAGCRIVAAARRFDRLKSLCDQINQHGVASDDDPSIQTEVRAIPLELDVGSDGASIEAAVNTAWNAFGRIDVLINNAGFRGRVHTLFDLSEEEWGNTSNINLRGAWLVSKYACIRMREAKLSGSVINISSIDGLDRTRAPGALVYAASKVALNTMTKVMAVELGMYNIRVNSISPGIFKSEITEELVKKDWLKNVAIRSIPLRTFGTIDPALTSLVRYLIHDSSMYVSGNIFIADSGATLPGVPIFSSLRIITCPPRIFWKLHIIEDKNHV